jgi:DNA-binding winged helix-turn-helix (wHTH) protein/TolB-like protein/Flp pilus assembly protein TadD
MATPDRPDSEAEVTAHSDAGPAPPGSLVFGEFRIDLAARRLTRSGQALRIQRKPLDVLVHLARRPGQVVSRNELLAAVWGRIVGEEALTRCISILRKLLDDGQEPHRYIETVWGEGYRFLAPVAVEQIGAPPSLRTSRRPGWLRWSLFAAVVVTLAGLVVWRQAERVLEAPVERLAVLPMTAESVDNRWLAEALTVQLTQTISRIEGITVVAHGTAADPARQGDPATLGRELNVGAVLTSHLNGTGAATGIRAQLIGTTDGSVLWSYAVSSAFVDQEPDAIERLAVNVARRLWANLQVGGRTSALNAEAYRHYLRGRYYWSQRSSIGLSAAISAFESALAIQPDYVDAEVGLAESWLLTPLYSATAPNEAMPRARNAATRAIALDPASARALAVLGVVAMQYDWDWMGAETRLRQALTLNPNDVAAEHWLGELSCYRRRFDDCRRHLQAAAALDPLSPVLQMQQGSPALFSGDFAGAVAAYGRARSAAPGFVLTRYVTGLGFAGLQEWERAIEQYRAALPELGLEIVGGPLIFAMARAGDDARARELLAELEGLAVERYVPPSKLAVAWLGVGDRERAMLWLDRALEARDDRLVYLAVDVHFLELHREPEFRARAARIGLLDVLEPI